jgi:hypothetical protein
MVDAWPWPIDVGLAQFYGGPFVALAWCAFAYSRQRSLLAVLPIVAGTLAFTVATLVVSLVHAELLSAADLAAWVWFGGFGALTVALAAMVVAARPQADFQGCSP